MTTVTDRLARWAQAIRALLAIIMFDDPVLK
jgi:hypothetical protein